MSSMGGGSKTPDRSGLIQSERERLQETERRMMVYDQLFGKVEKETIADSLGLLNADRLAPHQEEIDRLNAREMEIKGQMEADKATLMRLANAKESDFAEGGSLSGVSATIQKDKKAAKDYFSNWKTWTEGRSVFRSRHHKKKKDRQKKQAVNAAVKRYIANAAELNALPESRASALQAMQAEIENQQKASLAESTEQAQARVTGNVGRAVATQEKLSDLRDAGYGVNSEADQRAADERARQLALMQAAAEAGARNKAKSDVNELAKAKLGALAGSELIDRAAGDQLRNLSENYMDRAYRTGVEAQNYGAEADAATIGAVRGIGSTVGTIYGMASGGTNPQTQPVLKTGAINTDYTPSQKIGGSMIA